MILFVKKGRGMGFGCLAQLLFLVFIGFAIGSCQKLVTAARYKEQLRISGTDFINATPDEKWVKVTGVGVNLGAIVTMPLSGEVLVPVVIHGMPTQDGETQILLSVKEAEDVALVKEFSRITESSDKAWNLFATLLNKLNKDSEINGIVRHGMDLFGTDEDKIAKAIPGLSENFVIIDHGEEPGFGGAGWMLVTSLLLLVLSVASGIFGDRLNASNPGPPPLPSNTKPPPLPRA